MQQIFIELYNYGPAWSKCSENERADFIKKVIESVNGLKSAGADVIAYGKNSRETDRRAPYDFFCVYRVPSVEFQREFERQITASGWYNYFEQVNISGASEDYADVLLGNAKMVRPG
jgi:haloalkane dehalogenase